MVTFVGTQADFTDVLKDLVELEYDAIEAYKMAQEKLENQTYQSKMQAFQADHERHVERLNDLLVAHGKRHVREPYVGKQWLTKGKVALASLIGDDNTVLKAMLSNERDTNVAYELTQNHIGMWEDAKTVITEGLQDEKRHRQWLEETIKTNE